MVIVTFSFVLSLCSWCTLPMGEVSGTTLWCTLNIESILGWPNFQFLVPTGSQCLSLLESLSPGHRPLVWTAARFHDCTVPFSRFDCPAHFVFYCCMISFDTWLILMWLQTLVNFHCQNYFLEALKGQIVLPIFFLKNIFSSTEAFPEVLLLVRVALQFHCYSCFSFWHIAWSFLQGSGLY